MTNSAFISPQDALAERVRREKARRHLMDFSLYVGHPWYRETAHHRLVAEKLEGVARYIETKGREGIGRLMIFEPPRYGKTEQVSRLFPAWLLGRLPDSRIILASYGADLAEADSKAIREYVSSPRYAAVFGTRSIRGEEAVRLSEDSRKKSSWELARPHRGGVIAAGVGGRITGFGAHLLNINDPFKGRKEAESEAYRRSVMTWYRGNAYTRLEDGGAIIITHTRWDPEDLAGQLLTQMVSALDEDVDTWEVVFLPALALEEAAYPKTEAEFRENLLRGIYIPMGGDMLGRSPGEPLWEEKYPLPRVRQQAANIGDFEFQAQYQQLPRLAQGEFFDDEDFVIVENAPEGLQWYRYVDLALGKTETSDYNATVAVAMDGETLYLRDMLKVRDLDEFLEQLAALMLSPAERGTIWGIEDVAFQALVIKELMSRPELAGVAMLPVRPEGDKVTRARAWQLRAKQGWVRLVRGAWNLTFIRTAAAFPKGRHDDEIDSVSGGVQMIADEAGGAWKTQTSEAVVVEAEMFEVVG